MAGQWIRGTPIIMKISANPKRKWGQNFLADENVLQKIVRYFDPRNTDTVVEIGSGTGALTTRIAPIVERLIGVEIDTSLIAGLAQIERVEILNQDIRDLDLRTIAAHQKFRVIGNLPYYISTPILMQLISQRECIRDMVLMFQDEVAERILAGTSHHEYSMLSVTAQYFCEIDKGFRVSRNSFYPRPEVNSRVLHFQFRTGWAVEFDEYTVFLSKAFSQRRKQLRNNLSRSMEIEPERIDAIFSKMEIAPDVRAENLTPAQFERLILELKENH